MLLVCSRLLLDQLNAENEKLKLDNDDLNQKCAALESRLDESTQEYEQLKVKHQQALTEHGETVRGLKVNIQGVPN